MTNSMQNYACFLTQFTTFVYVPLFGIVVLYTALNGALTRETREFPKSRFLVMGGLDSVASVFMLLGGVHTAGSTQVVLTQLAIPVTLGMTYVWLKKRYHCLQFWGSFIIICGVFVVKSPDLFSPNNSTENWFISNILFLSSVIPMALSTVYKEIAFKDVDLDINYLQYWVAVFQFSIGFFVMPINSMPFLESQMIPVSELPSSMINGFKCLVFHHDIVVNNCGGENQPPCDTCSDAYKCVWSYVLFNIFYNIFSILVIKHGGAVLSFLLATLRLPLTSFAFYSKAIMGNEAQIPKATDFIGLAILLAGLITYRIGGLTKSREARRVAEALNEEEKLVPIFNPMNAVEPSFVRVYSRGNSRFDIYEHLYWNHDRFCDNNLAHSQQLPNIK